MHGLLLDAAERTPTAPAVRWVDRDRTLTYAEAVEAMAASAAALASLGVRPGDRVTIIAYNGLDYLTTLFGCWHLGAIPALVNVRFAEELDYYFADHEPTVVVFTHHIADQVRAAAAGAPSVRALVCMDGEQEGAIGLGELVAGAHASVPIATEPTAIAHLSYTSGTTGRPKGAALMHEPTVTAARVIGERLRITAADVSFGPSALSSSYQLVANLLPEFAVGATSNVMGWWTAETGLAAMRDAGATVLVGNPPLLQEVLDGARAGAPTPDLRIAVSGGGPVPPTLRRAFARELGIPLVESYGQSELGGFVALGFPIPRDDESQRIGPALPDKEVRVLGPDGAPLPTGRLGEIALRGGFMHGYWGKPEKTAEALAGGWLHTGDLGVIDDDGWITMRARRAELVETDAGLWFPRDVEEALLTRDEVAEVALIGLERDRATAAVAVMVLVADAEDDALDEDALRTHLVAATPGYPVESLQFATVQAMPMTPTGKIARAQLRDLLS
ncbi:class I adenylate-forming enzyme family protein [Microbacterium sp.]|uniref:class I adenylate-forming enzyme family protein n=1 Tax=Microbacterium sp. TaxID=51671 RepID=UPI003C7826F6